MVRAVMAIGFAACVMSGCAAAHDDEGTTTEAEGALSSRARPYVGEYVEVAFRDDAHAGTSLKLTRGGSFALVEDGEATRGRFTVVKGRKVLRPDFTHAYEDANVDVDEDLLRLTARDGSVTEYFVGPTYLRDAVLATRVDDATKSRFYKRLENTSCARTTCNAFARCIDVDDQSGKTRAICLEREWSIGSEE